MNSISFLLNGKPVTIQNLEPDTTLQEYLRSPTVQLMGSKPACNSGICGACTVLVVSRNEDGTHNYLPILACRYPLYLCDGKSIMTVEGSNSKTTRQLNAVQEKFVKHNATQCGFCLPGFLMSTTAVLHETHGHPTVTDLEEAVGGHLCRCTGYRTITDALKDFVLESSAEAPHVDVPLPSQELAASVTRPLDIRGTRWRLVRPVTLPELGRALAEYTGLPPYIIGGATNSISSFRRPLTGFQLVSVMNIPEMRRIAVRPDGIALGGAVTVQELLNTCRKYIKDHPAGMTPVHALARALPHYRAKQNRCVSTLAGEAVIGTDASVFLAGFGATVTVQRFQMVAGVLTPTATTCALADLSAAMRDRSAGIPVITEIFLPLSTAPMEFFDCYKLSRRADNFHADLVGTFHVVLQRDGETLRVARAAIGFAKGGGFRSTFQRCTEGEALLVGKPWHEETAMEVSAALPAKLGALLAAVPSGEGEEYLNEYCSVSGAGLLLRFFAAVSRHMGAAAPSLASIRDHTAPRPFMRSFQDYEHIPATDLTGTPHNNILIKSHAMGMSQFTVDIELPANGLYSAFILSTRAHARIGGIDASEALKMPGVVDFVCARDIPGVNKHLGIVMDTTVFADGVVECIGHPIGLIMATSQTLAEVAASKVVVQYTDLPAIFSIEEAIEKGSYLSGLGIGEHRVVLGNPDEVFATRTDLVVTEGRMYTGGQEHWYLEGQNCLVIPRDEHFMVYSSTQNPSKVQADVAGCLGISRNRVTCIVSHTGGGFGGKQDRPCILATAAAIGALKTGRPVRLALPRRVDFQMMGGRHPFRCDYKLGCTRDGKMVAFKALVVTDGGHCHDTTGPVLDKCIFQLPNAYTIPNCEVEGRAALTNHPTGTAFRGFGAPQHCIMMESIVDEMALKLGMPRHVIRDINLTRVGDDTFMGSFVSKNKGEPHLRMIWEQIMQSSDFTRRLQEVEAFNRQSRFTKRGIAVTPLKNGVCFEEDFMNQGMAHVHVLADGSVQVHHGGVEMGQGLHTKMAQIAAQALGVPLSSVSVLPTSTETCANTQPTAASSGTDLNGPAVKDCCDQISRNLAPLREQYPNATFAEICNKAYFSRITLTASSHFKLPKLGWHWDTKTGYTALYYDFGASVSEVEVDTLTGEFTILRADLLEDAGRALNPTLDLSQVEGGFLQGLGWLTMEEIDWSLRDGRMLTKPFTYAMPLLADTPLELHTSLLKGMPCVENVAGSKSSGEAPVLLGVSVALALRAAIEAARKDRNLPPQFTMDVPLTIEKIKLAIEGRAPSDQRK